MRSFGVVIAIALLGAAGTEAVAQAPPKTRPAPKLSEEKQARWDKARAILANPDLIELYSLDPNLLLEPEEKPKERFHGWEVLGKTVIKGAETRKAVLAAAGTIKPGYGVRCFEPRHGIRATAGGKTVDLVICFHCDQVQVYFDKDNEDARLPLTMDEDQKPGLDKVLTDAKILLPPPAKE